MLIQRCLVRVLGRSLVPGEFVGGAERRRPERRVSLGVQSHQQESDWPHPCSSAADHVLRQSPGERTDPLDHIGCGRRLAGRLLVRCPELQQGIRRSIRIRIEPLQYVVAAPPAAKVAGVVRSNLFQEIEPVDVPGEHGLAYIAELSCYFTFIIQFIRVDSSSGDVPPHAFDILVPRGCFGHVPSMGLVIPHALLYDSALPIVWFRAGCRSDKCGACA